MLEETINKKTLTVINCQGKITYGLKKNALQRYVKMIEATIKYSLKLSDKVIRCAACGTIHVLDNLSTMSDHDALYNIGWRNTGKYNLCPFCSQKKYN